MKPGIKIYKLNRLYRPFILAVIFVLGFSINPANASRNDTEIVELTEELMEVTEDLRGLDFIHDLAVELVTAEEIAAIIAVLLDEELSPEDDRIYSELYIFLGLMPRGSSLREDYQSMTEEQVAGLYDPDEKCFYVVDVDMDAMIGSLLGEDLGVLGNFLSGVLQGLGGGLEDFMTNVVIVHELTHALDDQHYDIQGTMESLSDLNSDDAQLAYQSLIEGNASRIMNEYSADMMGVDTELLGELSEMSMGFAESLMDYNPFLERIMLVPYLQGEVFVKHVIAQDGPGGLEDVFRDPPRSMEQVLHPERYTPNRDYPSYTAEPDLSKVLNGWEPEATDTFGELLISLMFELQTGDVATAMRTALGWDYDVITSWRSPGNDLAIAWVTIWDSEDDAEEFFSNYCELLELKYPSGEWVNHGSTSATYTMLGYAASLERSGKIVTIVEGVPEELAVECLEAAWPSNVDYY